MVRDGQGRVRRKTQWITAGALGAMFAMAWGALATVHGETGHVSHVVMPHQHGGPIATVTVAFGVWLIMSVAMMTPAVTPWVTAYATISRREIDAWSRHSTALFVFGYFALWAVFALAAALVQVSLQGAGRLHGWSAALGQGPAALLLVLAGLYQVSPAKAACLRHCRNPLGYLLSNWRGGPPPAFEMGFRHGGFCLGCCWLVMSLAFALGVMNVLWMVALTTVVCLEQLGPKPHLVRRFLGLGFVVWGVALLVLSIT